MSQDSDCLFCKIVAGEIPANIRHQNSTITAFDDISPQAPTHILVIPNSHVTCLAETEDPQIYADVLTGIKEVAKKLELKDFRVAVNNGAGAGQTVFHLHAHLLSGRKLQWPPG